MLRFITAAALISASLAIAAPGVALADARSDFDVRCDRDGGTMVDGECQYPDGSVETCSFEADAWACYRSEPKLTIGLFGKLRSIPKLIKTEPVHPGPVELGSKGLQPKFDASLTPLDTQAVTNEAPADKTIKLFDAPVMKLETTIVAPAVKLSAFN